MVNRSISVVIPCINIDHIVYIRPYYNNKSNTSAAIFTNGEEEISVFELTESNIHEYFDIPQKTSSADALAIIQDNYSDA